MGSLGEVVGGMVGGELRGTGEDWRRGGGEGSTECEERIGEAGVNGRHGRAH